MKMRIYHRYLGFFLAGIMAVYAISGIVLIFRDKDTFKKVTTITKVLPEDTTLENLGEALGMRRFNVEKVEGDTAYFRDGSYNLKNHTATYTQKELPFVLEKMTHLHKATSSRPLAFLNIFFGVSLFFFVLSSFWMFMPKTSVFKKGMYFTLAGLIMALLLIFL
ncbi:hypothetical protein [Fulvivirga ligni]|uniref:hypothetical protein n=1 Tax=Fulvivirga ligni TaxID=2904246 RepID=UPI001F366F31|nr:hypothetical protein [Fulvivirga ligni]UII24017.1 hypothetical protein LVD16_12385 [Fulvivirga ligni]